MILINKYEKDLIAEAYPNTCIIRAVPGKSSKHRYYCEEKPKVLAYLNSIRNEYTKTKNTSKGGESGHDRHVR